MAATPSLDQRLEGVVVRVGAEAAMQRLGQSGRSWRGSARSWRRGEEEEEEGGAEERGPSPEEDCRGAANGFGQAKE